MIVLSTVVATVLILKHGGALAQGISLIGLGVSYVAIYGFKKCSEDMKKAVHAFEQVFERDFSALREFVFKVCLRKKSNESIKMSNMASQQK